MLGLGLSIWDAALARGGSADPLAPDAPVLAYTGVDTGASNSDAITNDTTPGLLIDFSPAAADGDVITPYLDGVGQLPHTLTLTDVATGSVALGLPPLADGSHTIYVTHASGSHVSPPSNTIALTIDTTAPTITTSSSANCAENAQLAVALTADEAVSWSITGGADQARFELSGSTLRWASNGTKNYEAPNDADTNNTYVVQVTATDVAGNATNQTVTITVTAVNETPVLSIALVDQTATDGSAFTYQFNSGSFTDPDAGDTLTYTASGMPAWMSFTAGTRTFSGTPDTGDIGGPTTITVRATDTGSLWVEDQFTITVDAAPSYTGPGDILSFNRFWGGLRAYNTAYAGGAAIDIEDAAGSNAATIDTLADGTLDEATLAAWIVSNGTAYITKLYDQSGSGNDLTAASASAARFRIAAVTLGSANYAIHAPNAAQQMNSASSYTNTQPWSASVVYHRIANTSFVNAGGIGDIGILMGSSNNTAILYAGSVNTFTVTDAQANAVHGMFSNTSSLYKVNGGSNTTITSGSSTSTAPIRMGKFGGSNVNAYWWEMGICTGDQSSAFASIYANQNSHYGV